MNKFINRQMIATAPLLLSMLFLCFTASPAAAQESGAAAAPGEVEQSPLNQKHNLIRTLGLTPDQLAQIRLIREQNREGRQQANERLRSAQRALDEAIYADAPSETVIEERARELAAAQAAAVRLRALTELSIRRVLTPEQLSMLRTLRQRQADRRLGRELNMQRRLRDRRPRNDDGQPAFPRQRFRQRENAPALQTDDNNSPIVYPRERRRARRP